MSKLEISLGPRGLCLHTPSGRTLNISASTSGLKMIEEILRGVAEFERTQQARKGHIGAFPTQHVVDLWNERQVIEQQVQEIKLQKEIDRKEAEEKAWADKGIEINNLEFKL